MGVIVIACFKPKEGKSELLLEAVKEHLPLLRKEGLITEREGIIMRSKDGSIIEVFEWRSEDAVNMAHTNKSVLKLWEKFEEACEYIPVSDVEETKNMFPGFEPVNF
ncbi:MAG TPA: hypothetical protein PKA90_08210 [Ignavibacteria bacterium]|nr:hypothetical protein [Ignavibacteria bacterium]HMR40401.1 hypothetical protein [Ignavibacteria bacterium]